MRLRGFGEGRMDNRMKPENKKTPVKRRRYITDRERAKCRRVAAVYKDMFGREDLLVLDAGRYGFVKLQYYEPPYGFDAVETFTNSQELFEDLWKEWLYSQLIAQAKDSPLLELDYEDIFKSLPPQMQKQFMKKKAKLKKKANLTQGNN